MSKYLLKELEDKFNQLELQQEEDELDEANVTANLDGGAGPPRTPRAFAKSEDDMDDDHIEVLGYKRSKKSSKHFESLSKIDSQLENLIEATYRAYRKDESMSAKKKVNIAIKEINRKLYEVEQLVNQNTKLKTEMGLSQGQYWESTKVRFGKISERMLKISRKIKELGA
jgi:hypothetical protein